jgi:hypothetical protein
MLKIDAPDDSPATGLAIVRIRALPFNPLAPKREAAGVIGGTYIGDGVIVIGFSNPIALAVAAVPLTVLWILDLFGFDVFGGGGQAPIIPNGFYRMVHHLYEFITGAPYPLTPDQKNSIPYEAPFHGRVIWVANWEVNLPGIKPGPDNNGDGTATPRPPVPQDNVCTVPDLFQFLNKVPCTLSCCESHDNCYASHNCNESSWTSVHFGSCSVCNLGVVGCTMGCLGLGP